MNKNDTLLEFVPFSFPEVPGVRVLFQMRVTGGTLEEQGNVSLDVFEDRAAAVRNREELCRACGAAPAELKQVHGTAMVFDPAPMDCGAPSAVEADGMATARRNSPLMIKTADCQPLFVTDASGSFACALHNGWKGNRQGFPALAVPMLCKRYGVLPEELFAVRGPSLGPASSFFVRYGEEWGPSFDRWHDVPAGTVDLWKMTEDQLVSAGVPRSHIFSVPFDTFACSLPGSYPAFFSYRRSRVTGRQASLIWLE
ncbi:MAG: laccase domain-containing protein [Mailhella sp.]|nr:laccase domain-containing protein [Mailhella sp.]